GATLLCRAPRTTTGKATATHRSPTGVILPVMIGRRFAYLDAPTPIAFAHRGGAAHGDENSMAAFARAFAMGYRYIETDTHATADGVAVVCHDHSLARIAGRPERIHDLRWTQLARVRVDGGPVVPRLAEVLDAWPHVRLKIDVKADSAVVDRLAPVRAGGARERVLMATFTDSR